MKVVKRVFEKQLRKQVKIDGMHMGFMLGKSRIDATFLLTQIIKKYKTAGRHKEVQNDKTAGVVVLVDLEKTFNRNPRKVIWWALCRKGVIEKETLALVSIHKLKDRNKRKG